MVLYGPRERTLALNERLLQEGGTITTREHCERLGVSQATASRDLAGLVETGLVVRASDDRGREGAAKMNRG